MGEDSMTNAGDIAIEISEDAVVADDRDETYYVVGQTDVSDLPTVEGFAPVPDPNVQ